MTIWRIKWREKCGKKDRFKYENCLGFSPKKSRLDDIEAAFF
jgi:hypothetical protein